MKLTKKAHLLLKHILTFTGEKEIAPDGKKVDVYRRFNGEESAQRRFYFKATEEIDTPQKLYAEAKEKWEKENPKDEKEPQQLYDIKFNQYFQEIKGTEETEKIMNEEFEVKITDKTLAVIKKYFKEFGEKIGWTAADDKIVERIEIEFSK